MTTANNCPQRTAAEAIVPSNYELVFTAQNGALEGDAYRGRYELTTYNTTECAGICNADSDCYGFDIYFQRSPTEDPNSANCSNPPSTTHIRCSMWGKTISANDANNIGQYRRNFITGFAGSNGE